MNFSQSHDKQKDHKQHLKQLKASQVGLHEVKRKAPKCRTHRRQPDMTQFMMRRRKNSSKNTKHGNRADPKPRKKELNAKNIIDLRLK